MTTIPAHVDRNALPFAIDGHGNIAAVVVDGLENPHVLVCGGSQTGKTFALRLIAAYAASLGMIVVVFDPKWRWKGLFPERLPHVLVFDQVEEWAPVIEAVERELKRRYLSSQREQVAGRPDNIKDRAAFPGFLVIGDEFGTFLGMAEQWWAGEREQKQPKESPIHSGWQMLLWRGAECGIVLMSANHMATADMFPRGTKSRQMYGQQLLLGNEKEPTAYKAVMGKGADQVEVPQGVKGAGVWRVGNGPVRRIQTLFTDPRLLAVIAAHGIPVLRAGGHLDDAGRLGLHTDPEVRLPRPVPLSVGRAEVDDETPRRFLRPAPTPPDVQASGQDTDPSSAGDPDSDDTAPEDGAGAEFDPAAESPEAGETEPADEPSDLSVVGYARAAVYLRRHFGLERYSAESFRKDIKRKGVELPASGTSGNSTIWRVADLRAWYRAAHPKGGK